MFFDSHAHYDDEAFDIDRDELLTLLPENNIKYVVNAASNIESSKFGIDLAKSYDYIYAAVGVHPNEVQQMSDSDLDNLKQMCADNSKVVAIGEIGLDYHYNKALADIQKYWLNKQLELAKEVNLPVIIHSREAALDCFNLIKASKHKKGVIHCYSGSAEMALEYIKLGFYIGIGGVLTFNNAKKTIEVVEAIPLSKILIETDSPYLSPSPNRGKRNDSRNLIYISEKIAQIKQITVNKVAKVTCDNAKELFNI